MGELNEFILQIVQYRMKQRVSNLCVIIYIRIFVTYQMEAKEWTADRRRIVQQILQHKKGELARAWLLQSGPWKYSERNDPELLRANGTNPYFIWVFRHTMWWHISKQVCNQVYGPTRGDRLHFDAVKCWSKAAWSDAVRIYVDTTNVRTPDHLNTELHFYV